MEPLLPIIPGFLYLLRGLLPHTFAPITATSFPPHTPRGRFNRELGSGRAEKEQVLKESEPISVEGIPHPVSAVRHTCAQCNSCYPLMIQMVCSPFFYNYTRPPSVVLRK